MLLFEQYKLITAHVLEILVKELHPKFIDTLVVMVRKTKCLQNIPHTLFKSQLFLDLGCLHLHVHEKFFENSKTLKKTGTVCL